MSRSYPGRIRKQQGAWALYWPWPTWTLCEGCPECRTEEPCSLKQRKFGGLTRHESLEGAQSFALLRGFGPVLVEESE